MSWGRNFHLNDVNSAISFKSWKRKWKPFQHPAQVTSPPCSITDCRTMHLVHQALNSAVLAKGACSGDGANYCIHDVFHFFSTKWFLLSEAMKGINFHIFAKWCSFQLTHHRNRKYSQMRNHFGPVYITLRLSSRPQRAHFLMSGPSKALCLTVPWLHGNSHQHHELSGGV